MMKRLALFFLDFRLKTRPNEDADTVAKFCIKYGIAGEGFKKIVSFILGLEKFEPRDRIISLVRAACILSSYYKPDSTEKLVEVLLNERLYQYDLLAARYELLNTIVDRNGKEKAVEIFEKVEELSQKIAYPKDEILYTEYLNQTYMDVIRDKLNIKH